MIKISKALGNGLMVQLLASQTGTIFNQTTGEILNTVDIPTVNGGVPEDGMILVVTLLLPTFAKAKKVSAPIRLSCRDCRFRRFY